VPSNGRVDRLLRARDDPLQSVDDLHGDEHRVDA
jgi:hypothetical protein